MLHDDTLFERIHLALLPRFAGVRGDEYIYFCIFHEDERNPNLYVNKVKSVYHCWACGAKGSLLQLAEKLGIVVHTHTRGQDEFSEISHIVYSAAHPLTSDEIQSLCKLRKLSESTILKSEVRRLHKIPPIVRDLSAEMQEAIKLFVDRYIFPLRTLPDELAGIVGYTPSAAKKYIYPPQIKLCPWGLNLTPTTQKTQQRLFVVEGIFDALTAIEWKQYGIALLGANNSKLLKYLTPYDSANYRIYLAADFDKVGRQNLYLWARDAISYKIFPSWVIYAITNDLPVKDFNDMHRKTGETIDYFISKGLVQTEATSVFLIEETERRKEPLPPVIVFLMFSLGVLDAIETLLLVKKDLSALANKIADRIASHRQAKVLGFPTILSLLETAGADLVIFVTAATTTEGKKIILEHFFYHEVEGLFNILPHIDIKTLPLGLTAQQVKQTARKLSAIYRRLQTSTFFALSDYILHSIIPLLPD